MTKADQEALAEFDRLPDAAFVRLPVVQALYGGVDASTVWKRVKAGKIPRPAKLAAMTTAWQVGELRRDLAAIAAGASAGSAA
jgi:predicted DNA-binding transcriptional regulator AlpA